MFVVCKRTRQYKQDTAHLNTHLAHKNKRRSRRKLDLNRHWGERKKVRPRSRNTSGERHGTYSRVYHNRDSQFICELNLIHLFARTERITENKLHDYHRKLSHRTLYNEERIDGIKFSEQVIR